MGQVYGHQLKRKEAVEMYKAALNQDPTLWCAFERLCKLQIHTIEPSKVFNENHPNIKKMNQHIKDYMQSA